jgi:ribA/ribD-fused uncharacterized protein
MIVNFKSPETAFLSNFEPVPVFFEGITYPSVEHAFMSAKSDEPAWKKYCANTNISAADVKREGKTVSLVAGWDSLKFTVMEMCLRMKFYQEPFKSKLLATGTQNIQEGNVWSDTVWGVDLNVNPNVGENHLGRLIMKIRDELRGN